MNTAWSCHCQNPLLRTVPQLGNTKCHLCKNCRSCCFESSSTLHKLRKMDQFQFFSFYDLLVQHREKQKTSKVISVCALSKVSETELSCRAKGRRVMSLELGDIWFECICRTHHYTVSPHQDIALRGCLPGNMPFTKIRAAHFPISPNLNLQHLNGFRGNCNSHFWRGLTRKQPTSRNSRAVTPNCTIKSKLAQLFLPHSSMLGKLRTPYFCKFSVPLKYSHLINLSQ